MPVSRVSFFGLRFCVLAISRRTFEKIYFYLNHLNAVSFFILGLKRIFDKNKAENASKIQCLNGLNSNIMPCHIQGKHKIVDGDPVVMMSI